MNDLVTDSLVDSIKKRSIRIKTKKLELLRLWFEQGEDLIKLQQKLKCTQDSLTGIVGISKGGVYNYMKIARDARLKKLLYDSHSVGIENLNTLNQNSVFSIRK